MFDEQSDVNRLLAALERPASPSSLSNPTAPARSLRETVTELVASANVDALPARRVPRAAALTVAERSLTATEGRPDAERAFHAERAVARFLHLAAYGPKLDQAPQHLDLLPVAHPLSQAEHAMTAAALRHARGLWYAADPQLPDDVRPLTAAAYAAEPGTLEREHAFLRLQLTPGVPLHVAHPAFALTAALSFGGNSSAAKSARAKAQRRDRNGKFAFEGGLFRAFIKMLGRVFSGLGRVVAEPADKKVFQVEITGDPNIPDGLYDFPVKKADGMRARLKETAEQALARIKGLTPTAKQLAGAIDFDELMASRRDMPYGWELDPNAPDDGNQHYISDDGYAVVVTPDRKFTLRRQPPEDTGLQAQELGEFNSWYAVQQAALDDEEAYDAEVSAARGKAKPSAKLRQPATDAQKKLVQDLLANPLVPQELKDKIQADLDAKGKDITKAEIGQHIGDLKKVPASDAPTEKQINAIKRDVVAKGLPKAEADEILEKLPSMTKAEASKVIGRLKEMPDVEQPKPGMKLPERDFIPIDGRGRPSLEPQGTLLLPEEDVVEKRAAELKVGDVVVGKDGKRRTITKKFSNDSGFRFTFDDKSSDQLDDDEMVKTVSKKQDDADEPVVFKPSADERPKKSRKAVDYPTGTTASQTFTPSAPGAQSRTTSWTRTEDGKWTNDATGDKLDVLPNDPEEFQGFGRGYTGPVVIAEPAKGRKPRDGGEQPARTPEGQWYTVPSDAGAPVTPSKPKPGDLGLPTSTESLAQKLGRTKKQLQDVVAALSKLVGAPEGEKSDALDNVIATVLGGKGVPQWWTNLQDGISDLLMEQDPDDNEDVIDDIYTFDTIDVELEAMEQAIADRLPKAPEAQEQTTLDGPRFSDWAVKKGSYVIKNDKPYKPEGRTVQESTDYTDDPTALAAAFDEQELTSELFDALKNGLPTLELSFDNGKEQVPVEAVYDALRLQGKKDVDGLVAYAYDVNLGGQTATKNEDALAQWKKDLSNPADGKLDSIKGIGTKQLNEQTAVDGASKFAELVQKYTDQEATPQFREIADFLSKQKEDGNAKAMAKFMAWRESDDPAEREAFLGLMGLLQVSDGGFGQVDENFLLAHGIHTGEFDFAAAEGALIGHDYQALVRSKALVANGEEDPDSPESMAGAAFRLAALLSKPNTDILYRGIPMGVDSKALRQYITPGNTVALDLRPTSDELMVAQDFADIYLPEDGMASVVLAFPPGEASAVDMRGISPHKDESEFLATGQYVVSRVDEQELGNGRKLYAVELKRVTPEQKTESLSENQVRELPEGSGAYLIAPDRPQDEDVDPNDIAASYSDDVLRYELKAGIEDGTGLASLMDPEGETRAVSVEAVRDALKIQGVDTEAVLDDIYAPQPAAPEATEAGPRVPRYETAGEQDRYLEGMDWALYGKGPKPEPNPDWSPEERTAYEAGVTRGEDLYDQILQDISDNPGDYPGNEEDNFSDWVDIARDKIAGDEFREAMDATEDERFDDATAPESEPEIDGVKELDLTPTKLQSEAFDASNEAVGAAIAAKKAVDAGVAGATLSDEGMDALKRLAADNDNEDMQEEVNALVNNELSYDETTRLLEDQLELIDVISADDEGLKGFLKYNRDKLEAALAKRGLAKFTEPTVRNDDLEDYVDELENDMPSMPEELSEQVGDIDDLYGDINANIEEIRDLLFEGEYEFARRALDELAQKYEDMGDAVGTARDLGAGAFDDEEWPEEDQNAVIDQWYSLAKRARDAADQGGEPVPAEVSEAEAPEAPEAPSPTVVADEDLDSLIDDIENETPYMPESLYDQVTEVSDAYETINGLTEDIRDALLEDEYDLARNRFELLGNWLEKMSETVATARDLEAEAFDDPDWPKADQDSTIAEWLDLAKRARSAAKSVATTPTTPEAPEVPESSTDFSDPTRSYDLAGFERVGPQQGSNPGGTFRGPDGTEVYVKDPKSDAHASNEVLASALYELAGVPAAKVRLTNNPETGNSATFSEIIKSDDTTSFIEKLRTDEDFRKQVQSAFAIDAWLANWDVAGLTFDNIIVGEDGVGYRVDPGGALLFRAMGAPKGSALKSASVPELTSLLDPGQNSQSAAVFDGMTDEEKRESAKRLKDIKREDIEKLVKLYFDSEDEDNDVDPDGLVDLLWRRREAVLEELYGLSSVYDEDIYDVEELIDAINARISDNKAIASIEYTGNQPVGVRVHFATNDMAVQNLVDNLVMRDDPYFAAADRRAAGEATMIDRVILDGGATVNLADGTSPTEGYVVAVQGHNREVKADEFFGPSGEEILTDWLTEKKDVFAQSDKFMLGLWYDKDNDEVVLDVVEVFGADERDAAIEAGVERNQQAIWDIAAEDIVETGGTGDRAEQEEADGVGSEPAAPGDAAPGPADGEPGGDPGLVEDGDSELPGDGEGPETLDQVEDESTRATTAPKDIISVARIKETYPDHVVLDNNDIVVDQYETDDYTYETAVRRNTEAGVDNETYTVYARRVDKKTGEVTTLEFKNRSHSDKALNNQIAVMRDRLRGANASTRARFNKQKPVKNAPKPKQLGDMDDLEIVEAANKLRADGPDMDDEAKLGGLIQIASQVSDTLINREEFIDAFADENETFGSREAIAAVFDAVQAGDESVLQQLRKVTHLSKNGVELDSGMRVSWTDPKTGKVRVGTVVKRASTLDSRAYKFTDYVYVRFDDNKGKYVHRVSDRLVALDGGDKPIGDAGGAEPTTTTPEAATPAEATAETPAQATTGNALADIMNQVAAIEAAQGQTMPNAELTQKINTFIDSVLLAIRNKTGEVFTMKDLQSRGEISELVGTLFQQNVLPPAMLPALHLKLKQFKNPQELLDRTAAGEFTEKQMEFNQNILPGSVLFDGDNYWQVTRNSDVRENPAFGQRLYFGIRIGGSGEEEAIELATTVVPLFGPNDKKVFTPTNSVADDYFEENLSAPPLDNAIPVPGSAAPLIADDAQVVNSLARHITSEELKTKMDAHHTADITNIGAEHYPTDGTGYNAVMPGSVVLRPDGSAGIVTEAPGDAEWGSKNKLIRVTWVSGPAAGRQEIIESSNVRSTGQLYTYESARTLYNVTINSDEFENLVAARGAEGRAAAEAELAAQQAALNAKKKIVASGEKGPGKKPQQAAAADWSQSADPVVKPMTDVLKDVFTDRDADGQVTLVDSGDIEDQQVTVHSVTVDGALDKTLLRFKLTAWAGDRFVEGVMNGLFPGVTRTNDGDGLRVLRFNRSQTEGDLRHNTGTPDMPTSGFIGVDKDNRGFTYTAPIKDENGNTIGQVRLHRASAGLDEPNFVFDNDIYHDSQAKMPLAYHNQVQVLLDDQADPLAVERALRALGIEDVAPATPESVKILKENKLIALLDNKVNGVYNLVGEGREKALKDIEDRWGITADDLEYRKLHDGRVEILAPREFGEKIAEHVGVKYLKHGGSVQMVNGKSAGETMGELIEKMYIASTIERYGVGILVSGMSSAHDIYRVGAEYVFMTPDKFDNAPKYNANGFNYSDQAFQLYLDPAEVFRRLDWYYNDSDQYGSKFDVDPLEHLRNAGNGGELMLKHGLNLRMLLAMHANIATLQDAIQYLKSRGIADIDGVPIEEILGGK